MGVKVAPDTVGPSSARGALEMKDFSFRYAGADRDVLSHLDLAIGYGEFVVLSGNSGSGKSTLLASLIGSIPHIYRGERSGGIFVDGREVSDERVAERAKLIGSVLQDADNQIVHAKVEDEIAFGCENLGMTPAKMEELVGASARAMKLEIDLPTHTLSRGQKQRLITASALAMGRRILLLDEPLANLDRDGAAFLLETLRGLARDGCAVLLAEHRLDVALPYADRHIRLAGGRCEEAGKSAPQSRAGVDAPVAPDGKVAATAPVAPHRAAAPDAPHDRADAAVPHGRAAAAETEAILEAKGISFSIGGRSILRDISLEVRRGERLVILGENGCGKTTLLRVLARLAKPSAGIVEQRIDPALGRKASPAWFRKVGYVYQNPNYQLFMPTVLDEIAYQARSETEARRFADMFGLSELLERHPHSLSEGQKRKLGIAAVCATRPAVLLLDEPTVGQDDASLGRMMDVLGAMNAECDTTLVTVTHDRRCVDTLADRALRMEAGMIALP